MALGVEVSTLSFLGGAIFLSIVLLHLTKKYTWIIALYALQSCAGVVALAIIAHHEKSAAVLATMFVSLLVKVIVAPIFFMRLIRYCNLKFTDTTYLNKTLTLLVILCVTVVAYSPVVGRISEFFTVPAALISLGVASLFTSLFLIINKRDALSEVIAILSFENSVIFTALLLGTEQSFSLELGIAFDLMVWIAIAYVLLRAMITQFGTLDIPKLNKLKE